MGRRKGRKKHWKASQSLNQVRYSRNGMGLRAWGIRDLECTADLEPWEIKVGYRAMRRAKLSKA